MASIYSGDGNEITGGLQGSGTCNQAIGIAKSIARERDEVIYLDDDDGFWAVDPNGECEPAGYRVETANGTDTAEELGEAHGRTYSTEEECWEVASELVELMAGTHYEGTEYRVIAAQ